MKRLPGAVVSNNDAMPDTAFTRLVGILRRPHPAPVMQAAGRFLANKDVIIMKMQKLLMVLLAIVLVFLCTTCNSNFNRNANANCHFSINPPNKLNSPHFNFRTILSSL